MCIFLRRNVDKLRGKTCLHGPRPVSGVSVPTYKFASTPSTTPASSRRNSAAPSIGQVEMPRRDMYEALEAVAEALPDEPYAIIGGLALMLLGSSRPTKDVDIVVPDGRASEMATLLAAEGMFGTETTSSGRRRVWFDASSGRRYNVDVLEPHAIGQTFGPDGLPPVRMVQGHPVLEPAQLLNFKIASWTDRKGSHSVKKTNHATDITFLLEYLGKKGIHVTREEVYHATDEFLLLFCATYPGSTKPLHKIGLVRTGASRKNSEDDSSRFPSFQEWW